METKKCAIYIDLENIASLKNGSAISIPALMETVKCSIMQKFSAQSSFIINMAAGNSESIGIFDDTLIKYNFDIRTVKKISTIPGKYANRADLILSLEAFETLFIPTSVAEIYIFVTRDSDFSVIMGKLRKYGKQVLLVTDSESANLDIFKNTTDIILTFDELPEIPETIASVKIPENLNPVLKALVKILKPNEWTLYTSVAEKVLYKQKYTRFSNLIEEAKQKGIRLV